MNTLGTAVHHPADSMVSGGLEHIAGPVYLDVPVGLVGLKDVAEGRGEVVHQLASSHGSFNVAWFSDRPGEQGGTLRPQLVIDETRVLIEAGDPVTLGEQPSYEMSAHEAGATGDQYLHATSIRHYADREVGETTPAF
jgi:hypothetical protein